MAPYALSFILLLVALGAAPDSVFAQGEEDLRPVGPWVSEPGARVRSQGDALLLQSGVVRTNRLFSDFVLHFEFRLSQPQSVGHLLVRARFRYGIGNIQRFYRIALSTRTDGDDALGRVKAVAGALNERVFEPVRALRPAGQWQHGQLRAERGTLTVKINGAEVSTVDGLDELTGYIALQSTRGAGIEFRNVLARRLPSAQEPFGRDALRSSEAGVQLPRVLKSANPFYPREPFDAGVEGAVHLEVVVDANGSVGDVRVIKSLHPDLDEAAIACARTWRFAPGTRDGKPVAVIVTMEISFRRRE